MSLITINDKFFSEEWRDHASSLHDAAIAKLKDLSEKKCLGAEMTGWFDYPETAGRRDLDEVKDYLQNISYLYDLVVVIGIGGSSLGSKALYEALSPHFHAMNPGKSKLKPIHIVGDSISEEALIATMDLLDNYQPVFVVISKSGTTLEPAVAYRFIKSYAENRFGEAEAKQRTVYVTDPEGGSLREVADKEGYKAFSVPQNVGGRFSVLTPVGLVPLGFAGFDLDALLNGAIQERQSIIENGEINRDHPCLSYATNRCAAYERGRAVELLVYSEPKLAAVAEWWKQLYGESEGKEQKGLFPASAMYSRDLHSLGQFVQAGSPVLFETFLDVENPFYINKSGVEKRIKVPQMPKALDKLTYAEQLSVDSINKTAMQATQLAHFDGGTPSMSIQIRNLDERNLGALIYFFEVACAVSAGMIGVNAFDQPGVEDYKRNMFALLGKPGTESDGKAIRERLKKFN